MHFGQTFGKGGAQGGRGDGERGAEERGGLLHSDIDLVVQAPPPPWRVIHRFIC